MFALAVWDRKERKLTLARDRTGEKPLYVAWLNGDMVFASELRAIRCHAAWRHSVDPDALEYLLRLGYVPAPLSIYRGVFKLPSGSMLTTTVEDAKVAPSRQEFMARLVRYWRLEEVIGEARQEPWDGSEGEALDALQGCLDDAVRIRMLADVPVGALLSGGVDSTLVVSSMQRQSSRPVRTFTVGFEEAKHDESSHARRLAGYLGSAHEEILLPGYEALELVEKLPDIYDEPFADAAQLPSALVFGVARRHVTVALTGDGGDELFHGYQRYLDVTRAWHVLARAPVSVRRRVSALLSHAAYRMRSGGLSARLLRQSARIRALDFDDLYARTLSFTGSQEDQDMAWVRQCEEVWPTIPESLDHSAARVRFVDQMLSLPEGIHTKLDRASMWHSLELRVPFLDPRLIRLSWRLPEQWISRGRKGKPLLRALLARQVPTSLWDRPKQGFDVPVSSWLRGPLKDWACDLLSPDALASDPLIDARWARDLLLRHMERRADHGFALWSLLMYRSWSQRYAGSGH